MEPAPGYDGGPLYQQHQRNRGTRGQHFKRCDEGDELVLGVWSRGEGTGTCRVVLPVAVTDPLVAPVVAAPVDLAASPAQPVDTPVAAPLAPAPVAGPALVTNPLSC